MSGASDTTVLQVFLYFQTQLRLYHWKTMSHPRHEASGDLYSALDPLIDLFIESLQGSKDNGNYRIHYKNFDITFENVNENSIIDVFKSFKDFLENRIENIVSKKTDLSNIRDEMLSHVNKTMYRFSMK
jgi:hypothetical protein